MGEAKRRRNLLTTTEPAEYLDMTTGKPAVGRRAPDAITWYRQWVAMFEQEVAGDRTGAVVPCGTCTACCYHSKVDVDPSIERPEDIAHLDLIPDPDPQPDQPAGGMMLRKRDDGACVHLTDAGCSVHAHRPRACRTYDCRLNSLIGVLEPYDNGRKSPTWVFDPGWKDNRIFEQAMKMGAQQHQLSQGGSVMESFKAAIKNLDKNSKFLVQFMVQFEALPREQQKQMGAELAAKARSFWNSKS